MGERALTQHMGAQKHSNLARQRLAQTSGGLLSSWVRPVPSNNSAETRPNESPQSLHVSEPSDSDGRNENDGNLPGTSNSSNALNKWVSQESVLKAEILWNLHCTVNHLSYRSNIHTSAIFATIFSDSEIAQKIHVQKISALT